MQVLPHDGRNYLVLPTVLQHVEEDRERIATVHLSRSDGDLKLNVGRKIAGQHYNPVPEAGRNLALISGGANRPRAEGGIGIREQARVKIGFKRAAADQSPQSMKSAFA